jgi:hypothetical protein
MGLQQLLDLLRLKESEMSNGTRVQPGEVISSNLINQILERLEALEGGAGGNGSSGGESIEVTGFSPPNEQAVGQVMAILGQNLPFPPDGSTVLLGDFPVPLSALRIAPSNRQRIELVVPEIGEVPAGGRSLFVRVRGGGGIGQMAYRILPSTGVETPVIENVHLEGAPTNVDLIPMGEVAVIQGTGFSADPDDLTITFLPLGISPTPEPYPRPAGPPLDVSLATPNEIRVRVPEMSEVPTAGQTRIRLSVTVDGVPDPAVTEFFTLT